MTKQEFMAMSFPFSLKCLELQHRGDKKGEIGTFTGYELDMFSIIQDIRLPVLHPLSDLTNPITHKGETFVPIIELAKISMIGDKAERFEITKNKKYITVYFENKETFTFSIKFMSFYSTIGNKSQIAPYQLNLFQKLIEWHFDIAILIEKGEAIDVNTLEENPYK